MKTNKINKYCDMEKLNSKLTDYMLFQDRAAVLVQLK